MKSLGDYALLRTPVPALGRLDAFFLQWVR